MIEPVLAVDGLEAGYGGLQVLFGVTFDVLPNEIVAFMGSNGAGKTTTLRAITGQLRPGHGEVRLDGEACTGRAAVATAFDRAYSTFPILYERRTQLAGTLSGGQQQMLALARSLMSDPRVLLVDEASLGLSPAMTTSVFELLQRVNEESGVAILLVEQHVLALELASRAFVLEKGRIVDTAAGAELSAMEERLRHAYLGSAR